MKQKALLVVFLLCILMILSSCGKGVTKINNAADLDSPEYSVGVVTGTAAEGFVREQFANAELAQFMEFRDGHLAVKSGKIDAFSYLRGTLDYVVSLNADLAVLPDSIGNVDVCVMARLGNGTQMEEVNAFIAQYQQDGTYEDMVERWLNSGDYIMPEIPTVKHAQRKIVVGTAALEPPFNFYQENNQLAGFDMEFAQRMALYMNAEIEFASYNPDALLAALESGTIDFIIATMNATEEQREAMLFSQPYIVLETAILVRKDRVSDIIIPSKNELKKGTIGVVGGTQTEITLSNEGGYTLNRYESLPDAVMNLKSGRLLAVACEKTEADRVIKRLQGLTRLPDIVNVGDYVIFASFGDEELMLHINSFLNEWKKSSDYAQMVERWINGDITDARMPEFQQGEGAPLRIITNSEFEPFEYFGEGGERLGFDVELAHRIGEALNRPVEFVETAFPSIFSALKSKKGDIAIAALNERDNSKEEYLVSASYYQNSTVFIVNEDSIVQKVGFFEDIGKKFYHNLIYESRYLYILEGLWITVRISVMSAIFGTILAGLLCLMRRSKHKHLDFAARGFARVLQGTPIVVLLMIMFYVIFSHVHISPITVAVISFTANFSAYVSEIMLASLATVSAGELEAAAALGFTKTRAFIKIALPQAAKQALPIYRGECISMVKMTSVVGYIAICDLTKASDIIRSRTYEAFFPLILVAVIYFMISNILVFSLRLIERKLDPKRRKREIAL